MRSSGPSLQRSARTTCGHTHATLAFRAGVHPRVVQERLGHANVSITLDTYSHVDLDMQAVAAARVTALSREGGRDAAIGDQSGPERGIGDTRSGCDLHGCHRHLVSEGGLEPPPPCGD
jgi:hypothetical protein